MAARYVSTGDLPAADDVAALIAEAHERFRTNDEGERSRVYPALERVAPDLFGVCIASTTGATHAVGDADVEFSIMSVAKPFVFALVCDALGTDAVEAAVGVNATGRAFDSLAAVEQHGDGRTNPMVNPGAIVATSLVPGATLEQRWTYLRDGLSRFAGRQLVVDEDIHRSASATNQRNRAIAALLESYGRLPGGAQEAVDLYTLQSCLRVSARDLAVMGATLADGGVNPITGVAVIDAASGRAALASMATAGLYETSGEWLQRVGLPDKSGIGGGIVTVSPGKGGLGTFAPPLDRAGNSVKGQLVARWLSRRLGLDIFSSSSSSPSSSEAAR